MRQTQMQVHSFVILAKPGPRRFNFAPPLFKLFFALEISMDFSQYIRLKNEAANVYAARTKTVDSSFLSFQRRNKAAYAGYANIQATPYYNGAPVVNPILYDISSCPIDHQYTQGFTTVNKVSQHEDLAIRKAGLPTCNNCGVNYATASPGIQLKSLQECSTILTQYDNQTPAPGQWKPHGYGINHYFPRPDACPTVYTPAVWPLK
jgi:hypothetical protein